MPCELKGMKRQLSVGSTLGKYVIKSLMRTGVSSEYYLASRNDGVVTKDVVIKVITNLFKVDRRSESRDVSLSLFDLSGGSENICSIYDVGVTPGGLKYIVMEYVLGLPLDKHIEQNQLSVVEILKVFIVICEAVDYGHQKNVLHCDISPSKIILNEDGNIKIIDFDILKTKNLNAQSDLTNVDYTSPEKLEGSTLGTYSDIYSLGALLYKALTGKRPFSFLDDDAEKINKIINGQPIEFFQIQNIEGLPFKYKPFINEIFDIIKKCLNTSTHERYKSVRAISKDITRFIELKTPTASNELAVKEIVKISLRNYKVVSAVLVLFFCVAGISTLLYMQKNELADQKRLLTLQSEALLDEQKKTNALLLQIQEVINYTDPRVRMGDAINVKSLLTQGELKLNSNKNIPDDIKAMMFLTLGDSYYGLAEYFQAEKLYTKAFDIYFKDLIDLSKPKIEAQVKILNSLNMQNKYDDTMVIGGDILQKLTMKGIEYPYEVDVLFSFSLAMRRTVITADNFGANFDFNGAMNDIKNRLWTQLSPTQKVKLLSFQISEIYYSFGDDSRIVTSGLDEKEYTEVAVPRLIEAKKYAHEGLVILIDNQVDCTLDVNCTLEVELLMWLFRLHYELKEIDKGNEFAELATSRALEIYGFDHIEFARLYLVQYAMFSATDVHKSLVAMEKSYNIIDKVYSEDNWERYYYLDLLSQAYLDAGYVNKSKNILNKIFKKINSKGLKGITKRAFDGISSSLFRFADLNELYEFPKTVQNLFVTVMDEYDNIWPGWLTQVDKNMLLLLNKVITRQSSKSINQEANKVFQRLLMQPQREGEYGVFTDSVICSDLIRIYDQLDQKEMVKTVYQHYKRIYHEDELYVVGKIYKIQEGIRVFGVVKDYEFGHSDALKFKQTAKNYLEKHDLMTSYYSKMLEEF